MLGLSIVLASLLALSAARPPRPNYDYPALAGQVSTTSSVTSAVPLTTPATIAAAQGQSTGSGTYTGDITHYEVGLGSCNYVRL